MPIVEGFVALRAFRERRNDFADVHRVPCRSVNGGSGCCVLCAMYCDMLCAVLCWGRGFKEMQLRVAVAVTVESNCASILHAALLWHPSYKGKTCGAHPRCPRKDRLIASLSSRRCTAMRYKPPDAGEGPDVEDMSSSLCETAAVLEQLQMARLMQSMLSSCTGGRGDCSWREKGRRGRAKARATQTIEWRLRSQFRAHLPRTSDKRRAEQGGGWRALGGRGGEGREVVGGGGGDCIE